MGTQSDTEVKDDPKTLARDTGKLRKNIQRSKISPLLE
jgi:hypothetical protein